MRPPSLQAIVLELVLFHLSGSVLGQLPQNGDIRLASGSSLRGRLEIYLNETWGTVCYSPDLTEWERGAGRAACRQLGYQDVSNVATVTQLGIPEAPPTTPVILYSLNCPYSTEQDLNNEPEHVLRCTYESSGACDHTHDMAIECTSDSKYNFPYEGEVRLVKGGTGFPSSGVLETYVNTRWVTVCANQTQLYTAHTVCRQLGYTGASNYSIVDQTYISDTYPGVDGLYCNIPYRCLSSCLQNYPPDQSVVCDSGIYTVNCTFDVDNSQFLPGSEDVCLLSKPSSALLVWLLEVVGGAVGGVALVTIAIVITLLLCFFKEGCPLQQWRYRRQFQQIN